MHARVAFRKLALAALAGVVGVGLANLLVAHFLPLRRPLFRIDEELLFTTRPGARRITVMDPRAGGEWVHVRINAEGRRGPLLAAGGGERIVVLGDSLVLAENVPLHETFVERLGEHLERAPAGGPARAFEVVNAGVTGYGPDQALLKFSREVEELQPDTVLLVLCATNDFGDLVRNKLFVVDDAGELVPFPFELDPIARARFAAAEREGRRWALARLFDTWRAGRRARGAGSGVAESFGARGPSIDEYLQACRAHHAELFVHRDPRVYSLFEDTYDADVAIFPEWDSSRAKVALMRAVLERLARECAAREIALRALVVPSAVDLAPGFSIRVDPQRWPGYDAERLARTLVELLDGAGVPVLDLTGAFRDAGPDGLFVGAGDFHWNAAGQELAARECAGFLGRAGG